MAGELGLRERKKVRTRSAIQHHALRLFREQGYDETTVSQIAEAAEVSESTFFRYFASKEATVLEDDFDAALFELLRAQPADLNPIQAMRRALRGAFADISPEEVEDAFSRATLILSHPELKGAIMTQLVDSIDQLAVVFGERLGRPADDIAVRAQAGAVVGALMAVTMTSSLELDAGFVGRMDAALGQLEAAFALPEARAAWSRSSPKAGLSTKSPRRA